MLTPKLAHKIVLSALILLVLFFLAGFIYTYFSDRPGTAGKGTTQGPANQFSLVKPPPKPGPNAAVGVAEEAFDSPIAPGQDSSIIISTTAGASCQIALQMPSLKSSGQSLAPQIANAYGTVTWSWTVPSSTPFGSYPLSVKCSYGKNWAVYDDILVVKQ